jgi:hypothetical protein
VYGKLHIFFVERKHPENHGKGKKMRKERNHPSGRGTSIH